MILWHNHHIIPRHMGGTDEPRNILRCNVAMHSFLHKLLYEQHGRWQDKIAWQGLEYRITHEESVRLATRYANIGNKHGSVKRNEEFKQNLRNKMKGNSNGFKKGCKPWNKGLTKETDERVLQTAQNTSKGRIGRKFPRRTT